MGDEAHVRLVDAHAEGDGGDHDDAFALEEARPGWRSRVAGVQAGVVGQRARGPAPLSHAAVSSTLRAAEAIDDAGVARRGRS